MHTHLPPLETLSQENPGISRFGEKVGGCVRHKAPGMCWEGEELSELDHEPFPLSLRPRPLLPFPLFGVEPGWSRYIPVPRISCESLGPPPYGQLRKNTGRGGTRKDSPFI